MLPLEVKNAILSHLSLTDLASCLLINSEWCRAVRDALRYWERSARVIQACYLRRVHKKCKLIYQDVCPGLFIVTRFHQHDTTRQAQCTDWCHAQSHKRWRLAKHQRHEYGPKAATCYYDEYVCTYQSRVLPYCAGCRHLVRAFRNATLEPTHIHESGGYDPCLLFVCSRQCLAGLREEYPHFMHKVNKFNDVTFYSLKNC